MNLQALIDKGEVVKEPVIEKCSGCSKVEENQTCAAYINPTVKWRLGNCNLATHIVIQETKVKPGYKPGKFGKKRRNR